MKKCVKLCKYSETSRPSSRLCIRVLKVWGPSLWIPLISKRKSPNSNKKRSSCSPRSTYSKTKAIAKTFKHCSRLPQSWERSRSKTQDWMRRNANSPRQLKWTSISCCQSDRDWWTPKKLLGRTTAPNRCLTTCEAKPGPTEKFATKWLVVNSTTKRSAFRGSRCFSRSPWQLNLSLKGWHLM